MPQPPAFSATSAKNLFHNVDGPGYPYAMPSKRKTLKHYPTPGHAHDLTFSCFRRLPLLNKDRTRLWFLVALERARVLHQFDLWVWVIMPDHAHLLIRPRRPDYDIGLVLRSIKQPVGARAVAYLREKAPAYLERLLVVNARRRYYRFWQPGAGFDRNVDEPRAAHEMIEYTQQPGAAEAGRGGDGVGVVQRQRLGGLARGEDSGRSDAADAASAELKASFTERRIHDHREGRGTERGYSRDQCQVAARSGTDPRNTAVQCHRDP
jgi:putative transposase